MSELTPKAIVAELNKHIIGQSDAKKAVAIALRNRWRRMQVSGNLKAEIKPKNILMIGPTGVGKTEIARRLAILSNAPFIKIEATKFTEVGYVGRDAESIIRDLIETAIKIVRKTELAKVQRKAEEIAEETILDILLPSADNVDSDKQSTTRQKFRKKLREGDLDDSLVEIGVRSAPSNVEIVGPPGMEDMTSQLHDMFQNLSKEKRNVRKMPIKNALVLLAEEEADNLIDEEEIRTKAVNQTEQNGIVFIDEIDKIVAGTNDNHRGGVSREGVQRDLLPLIEGSTVNTKYGTVNTDHILFITSGAFHLAKPSDLIPELQGRLPIRVNLSPLSADDFKRILVEPDASLTEQYTALIATEKMQLKFAESAINKIAEISWNINETTENIGARRLHTVMERLLEEVSFVASEQSGKKLIIDDKYVVTHLSDLTADEDLSRYVL